MVAANNADTELMVPNGKTEVITLKVLRSIL